MPRIPLSQILSTTTTPKHSNPKTAVISIAFEFLLTAKDQLPPHSFDTLIAEFMLYEETLIPGTAKVYHDFGVVLCYIYEEILNGYPELQNTVRQRYALCKAVHLVQLVSRVRMIAGEAKYQAVLNSIRGCWSGKIDMAAHIKQLRELFMKDYPDILAEFEEEWRPQRPTDCYTSTLDAFVYIFALK
ncbi:hypothetical protein CPB85DRAFT_1330631 [Mucidula mucida]|nr:hypothetical protein CPB85DRAFT_1330631 [Mucidula mucida]